MIKLPRPSQILLNKFPFSPNSGQKELFQLFDDFLEEVDPSKKPVFQLKGYAGTGKTTIISTLVKVLPSFNLKFVLLAPTGRAAKVMSNYTKKVAFTIHKKIYKQIADPRTGLLKFERQRNYHKKTVFIVDETSMLSENDEFGEKGLLADLIDYVFEKKTNKLILIGDKAQLPPVHETISAALEKSFLEQKYKLDVTDFELTEVMRQELKSGILYNATSIRKDIFKENFKIRLSVKGFKDIFRMPSDRLDDGLRYAYHKYGTENTIIICRSNKRSNQYNNLIRRQIHYFDDEINAGDILMVVRNNYFYRETPAGFVANGDFMEVTKIKSFQEMYGFRFADVTVRFVDYQNDHKMDVKIMLDTLHSNQASLSQEENQKLYEAVMHDYLDYSEKERNEALRFDLYLNALQVKFAYALTCHKSQGGQWKVAIVDQGFLNEEMINHDYLRWLYTALTRSTHELYLVNFHSDFFV